MFGNVLNKKLDDLITTGYTEKQSDLYIYILQCYGGYT